MSSLSTNRRCDACDLPPRLSADQQTPIPLRKCCRCHSTWYHDVECQRRHFSVHKKVCRRADTTADNSKTINVPKFRVEERPERGRCLAACQSIPVGQTVAAPNDTFSPLVPPVLNEANRHTRCAVCFGSLDSSSLQRYDQNPRSLQYPVLFCSAQCRHTGQTCLEEEERFVVHVCQSHPRIHPLPTALLLYRILRNIASEEANESFSNESQISLRAKVEDLEAHHDSKLSSDEQNHVRAVVTVTKQLLDRRAQLVDTQEQSILESFSVDYMVQVISRIKINGFTVCDGESLALGISLFHVASNMNHSCRPNALQTFVYGRQGEAPSLRVTACTTIQSNEEVCISYIDNAYPRHVRRQRLRNDYHFWCTCESCCDDKHDDCLVGLLCPKKGCSGMARRVSQTELAPKDIFWECDACGNTDFTIATDLIRAFHSQDKNQTTIKERERMYASLNTNFSGSSWYVREWGEQLVHSLLDAIDGSDVQETQRLCAKALAIFDELLSAPATSGGDEWRVLKSQMLLYKRAKLQLYLLPDPRRAISDLQSVQKLMSLYYPKDHEIFRMLQDTISQAFA